MRSGLKSRLRSPAVRWPFVTVSSEVDESDWDRQLEQVGGSFFHCCAWIRHRCVNGGQPLYLTWHFGRSDPVGIAAAVVKPDPASCVGKLASRLHFNSPPAASGAFEFIEPLRVWAAHFPGIVGITLGALDARVPWSPSDPPGAIRRHEFLLSTATPGSFLDGMRPMQRRSVARARRDGVEIRRATTPADLHTFVRLREETSARLRATKGVRVDHTDPSDAAPGLAILTDSGRARLYLAERGAEPVAACLFACFAGSAYYLQAGGNDAGRRLHAAPLVFLEAFEDLARDGFRRINLGGVDAQAENADHPDHGLYTFKLGLGSQPIEGVAGALRVKPLRGRMVDLAVRIRRR
jgi:hypothetical protein